jgi:hypothetical protein
LAFPANSKATDNNGNNPIIPINKPEKRSIGSAPESKAVPKDYIAENALIAAPAILLKVVTPLCNFEVQPPLFDPRPYILFPKLSTLAAFYSLNKPKSFNLCFKASNSSSGIFPDNNFSKLCIKNSKP